MATNADNGAETLDRVLSSLDALHTRMDSMEAGEGSKNPIKSDAAKSDATKSDGEEEDEKKEDSSKSDASKTDASKADEEEDEKKEDSRKDQGGPPMPPQGGTGATAPPPVMPDKKKDAKKDAAKADQDDKADATKSDARADAVEELRSQLAAQAEIIKRLEGRMRPVSDEEHQAFAEAQAKADSVFAGFGEYAPRPMEGESLLRYRKRLATVLKKHSTDWKDVKFSELPEAAFAIVEGKVYADAISAAAHPVDLAPGELRAVKTVTPAGHSMTTFLGKDSFVKGLSNSRRAKINAFPGSRPTH